MIRLLHTLHKAAGPVFFVLLATIVFAEEPAGSDEIRSTETNENRTESTEVALEWTPVKDVKGYIIQIARPDGTVILQRKTRNEKINLRLQPGLYKRRIGLVNKFDRTSVWTQWESFSILRSYQPEIERIEPVTLGKSKKERLTISGKHISKATEFEITVNGQSIPVVERFDAIEGQTTLVLDTSAVASTDYDVTAKNTGKPEARKPKAVSIREDTDIASKEDKETKENKEDKEETVRRPFEWTHLIPGYPQFQRGDSTKGYLITGSMVALAAVAVYYANEANAAVSATNSDPLIQWYGNPAYAAVLGTPSTAVQYAGFQAADSQRQSFNSAQAIHFGALGLLGAVYGYHLYDVFSGSSSSGQSRYDPVFSISPYAATPYDNGGISAGFSFRF